MAKKVGRPKSDFDLPKHWRDEVLELYSEGASDVEIRALIIEWRGSISQDLWERWMKEEVEFSVTIKKGKALSAAWWERSGRKNLLVKDFNYTGWYMNMKNRFGWADKIEQKSDISIGDFKISDVIKFTGSDNNNG